MIFLKSHYKIYIRSHRKSHKKKGWYIVEKYNDENKKAQKTVEVIKEKELEQMIGQK